MTFRDLARGRRFDEAAAAYDRYRPRYPTALFDDVVDVGGVPAGAHLLEIGCGPGVATAGLLERGWSVLALEPGEKLARIARERFDPTRFRVEVATFDEWDARGRRFDAVFSASAYHWVAPDVRWPRAAAVLDPGGVLALVGHENLAVGSFHEFGAATRDLRTRYGVDDQRDVGTFEELARVVRENLHDIGALWESLSPQGSTIVAGGLFEAPVVRLYPWSATYSTEDSLGLLGTYSRYLVLDGPSRNRLFAELAEIIERDFGGSLTCHYVSVLAVARRS